MKRLAKAGFWTVALVGSLVVAPLIWGVDAVAEDTSPGQGVFLAQKCNMCHSVSTVGIEAKMKSPKMMGPDLKGVGERVDAELLEKFMRKLAQVDGKDHKKDWKGTDAELDTLIAWLGEQKGD